MTPSADRRPAGRRPTLRGHVAIARVDHWFKNVFVIPGIIAAIGVDRVHLGPSLFVRIGFGMLSVCLVASSNYVVNEVLDAPSDRAHPGAARPGGPASGGLSVRRPSVVAFSHGAR